MASFSPVPVDVRVRTANAELLDTTVGALPGVQAHVVPGSWNATTGVCVVRAVGDIGFLTFALRNQGYGEVVDEPAPAPRDDDGDGGAVSAAHAHPERMRYVVITPGGKCTVLDAGAVHAGDGLGFTAQCRELVGIFPAHTALRDGSGAVLIVSDDVQDDGHALGEPNPSAAAVVAEFGGQPGARYGVHIVTGLCESGPTDLDDDQIRRIHAAARTV